MNEKESEKRLLSLAMSIVLLGQIGVLGGVSAQTATETEEAVITPYAASELADILLRTAICIIVSPQTVYMMMTF